MREDIINFFEKGIFPIKGNALKTEEEKLEEIKKETKEEFIYNALIFPKKKNKQTKDLNNDLFKTYFNFLAPIDWETKLFKTKDKKKNREFVEEIKDRWSRLKDEIEKLK